MLPRAVVDARVRVEQIAPTLPGGRRLTDWLTATPDEVLVEQSGVRVLIRGTEEVLVDLDDGADTALLGPILYGAAVRTLLLHAGIFCLHATIVRHGETVLALAGHSGAGKTTTATALCRFHGAALLVDDLVPTRVVGRRPQVQVFERPVHLTVDAVDQLGLRGVADATVLIPGPKGKVALPATRFGAAAGETSWIDLDRLFALSVVGGDDDLGKRADASAGVIEREVSGADRLRWIVRLSNVTGLSSLGDRSTAYFAWATELADSLGMVRIERPDGAETLLEVCTAVLAAVRRRGGLPEVGVTLAADP